jgi:hypothetical protein
MAGSPALAQVLPRGGARGSEMVLDLTGGHLSDALDLVLDAPGIELRELTVERDDLVHARIAIAPDAPLGLHAVRVRTRTGLSGLRTFAVGALPEIDEVEGNDTREKAQPIALDVTVRGVAQNEDADWYAFDGHAGEQVAAEIEALRLGGELFDSHLALLDERGFELSGCDDSSLARQDPIVAAILPADGRYYLRVRESAYRGSPGSYYLLHAGRFSRPLVAFPLGARRGEHASFTLLGDPRGERTIECEMPAAPRGTPLGWLPRGAFPWCPPSEGGVAPSPLLLDVADLQGVREIEPNDALAEATPFAAPAILDGRIEKEKDRDLWRFTAHAGESFDLVVRARCLRSPLDARLLVLDAAGNGLAQNDDEGSRPDSRLRFQAPADGEYVIQIDDHLGMGSPLHAYRVVVAPPAPALHLEATRDRQSVCVPRGGRGMLLLSAERIDFDGPLAIELAGLPETVRASIPACAEGITTIPLVFEATSEATLGHALLDLSAKHADPAVAISAAFRQDVELTYGQNLTLFCAQTIERVPLAVTEEAPFSIELEPPSAPLVQDGSGRLMVTIARREGFAGAVTLVVPFLPPGVSAQQGMVADPATQRIEIPIDANGGARIGRFPMCVTGSGDPGGGPIETATALCELEIAAPFVRFHAEGTSVERGGATSLSIAVEKLAGFTGTAEVELVGLPPATTAATASLDAERATLSFAIQTTPESPVGRHRGLFCIARFATERGLVVHRLPAAELRIDEPLPATAAAPPPPPPPPPPAADAAPAEKVETRLEKLRRETAERRVHR